MEVVPSKKDLNSLLVKLLKCPVCYNHLYPPIMMCRNGHNICNNCISNITTCPVCKTGKPSYRNLFAEQACGNVSITCEYRKYGCDKSIYLDNYSAHLADCSFKFDCRIRYLDESKKCTWVGDNKLALKSHVLTSHVGHHLDSFIAEISCKIKMSREFFFVRLVSAYHKLFWICIKYCPVCKYLDVNVTYVGSNLNAPTFKYSFEFTLTDVQRTITIEGECLCLHNTQSPLLFKAGFIVEELMKKGEIEGQVRILNNVTNNNADQKI